MQNPGTQKSSSETPVKQMLTEEEKKLVTFIATIAVANTQKKAYESGDNLYTDIGRQTKQLQHTGTGHADEALV